MKESSRLLLAFVAALRAEGAELPESDANTVSTLADVLDGWTYDPSDPASQETDRTVHTLWVAANEAFDPNFKENLE
jgi:hypothetical protein